MTTHRLPLLLVLAGALIAFPERASSQEATLTPTAQPVTIVVPDDGARAIGDEGDVTPQEAAPLSEAIVPIAGWALTDRDAKDISPWPAPPPEPEARPPGLIGLYAGFATLQALDAHSTLQAVGSGYQESNPIVGPFTQSPAAMFAFKAATTTVTILVVEKLRRRHRGAAMGLMIAANVAYAGVVAYNYRKSAR